MISSDGIDVYLRPVSQDGITERIPELDVKAAKNDQGHSMSCSVPYIDGPLEIVVRYPADFNMYSATTMHVGIGDGDRAFPLQSLLYYSSEVAGCSIGMAEGACFE